MSTQEPRQVAENAPELFAALDAVGVSEEDDEDDTDESESSEAPARGQQSTMGLRSFPPPYKGSDDLGGTCPECDSMMDSRVKAQYDGLDVRLVVIGKCRGECGMLIKAQSPIAFDVESVVE